MVHVLDLYVDVFIDRPSLILIELEFIDMSTNKTKTALEQEVSDLHAELTKLRADHDANLANDWTRERGPAYLGLGLGPTPVHSRVGDGLGSWGFPAVRPFTLIIPPSQPVSHRLTVPFLS